MMTDLQSKIEQYGYARQTGAFDTADWRWREVAGLGWYEIMNHNGDGGYLLPHISEQTAQKLCDGLNGKEATNATS